MYSLILMTAMAGAPDATSFGWRSSAVAVGCSGCFGCSGGVSYSYAYAASVGPAFPRLRGMFCGPRVYAGCYSTSFAPGFGSCYGSCYGPGVGLSCFGSCYGSCYGFAPATFAAPVVVPGVAVVPGGVCYAPAGEHYGTVALSGTATPKTEGGTHTLVAGKPTVTVETAADAKASARLAVELPAAAKLYVDGLLIAGDGASRQFHTPELTPGKAFFYEVKAEVEVNGLVETERKRVVVKAGESLRETFGQLIAKVEAAGGPAVAAK